MINQYIDSIFNFNSNIHIKGYSIEYKNMMEVCQGGPLVGDLYINGKRVSYNRYGGPLLNDEYFIYITIFSRSSFILSKIRMSDFETLLIGSHKDVICLKNIDDDKIYYYDSIYNDVIKVYDLSPYTISNATDTPTCFLSKFMLNDYSLEYHDIEKVGKKAQIGNITINGKSIDSHKFGSPFLYNDTQILIPVFVKGFFRSAFKLALINLSDLSISIVGDRENFISLICFENCNKVIYYTDLNKKVRKAIMI